MSIILASASPRRQELLKSAGIEFIVHPANVVEARRSGETPKVFAERTAKEKALAVQSLFPESQVLGADTVVIVDDEVLGKPRNEEDALRMLRMLSGRRHAVTTGVCLVGAGFEDTCSETTVVEFSEVTDAEIRDYIATGEPMDKAGAYAIQGIASRWIPRIQGDYSNVVGLPVFLVWRMLREHKMR
jgi:septum formation protein